MTVESKGGELVATRWQGHLIRGSGIEEGKKGVRPIAVAPIASNVWTLQEALAVDCPIAQEDEYVLFIGGIPPGHFDLRRRMKL